MRYASIVIAAAGAQDDLAAVSVASGLAKRHRAAVAVVVAVPRILSDAARAEIGRIIAALRGDQ
jgi:hypothetical protein